MSDDDESSIQIRFQAPAAMKKKIKALAKRAGISEAEFIRQALQRTFTYQAILDAVDKYIHENGGDEIA